MLIILIIQIDWRSYQTASFFLVKAGKKKNPNGISNDITFEFHSTQ